MTFVLSAMCSYMMYFIVAPAARRRLSSDYLVIWLWNRMAKVQYFVGSIYTLYVCTKTL
jgi:hypothetical protein